MALFNAFLHSLSPLSHSKRGQISGVSTAMGYWGRVPSMRSMSETERLPPAKASLPSPATSPEVMPVTVFTKSSFRPAHGQRRSSEPPSTLKGIFSDERS